jgi:hypothetical protein
MTTASESTSESESPESKLVAPARLSRHRFESDESAEGLHLGAERLARDGGGGLRSRCAGQHAGTGWVQAGRAGLAKARTSSGHVTQIRQNLNHGWARELQT